MPPTLIEGFGVGHEIAYSYKLPAGYHVAEHKIPTYQYPTLFNRTNNAAESTFRQHDIQNNNEDMKPSNNADIGNKNKETIEDFDEKVIKIQATKNADTGNENDYTSAYQPNIDYSEFYNPVNKQGIGTKTDYYLNYSPKSQENLEHGTKEITNLKLTRQFIETLREPKSMQSRNRHNKEPEQLYQNEFNNKREIVDKSKPVKNEKNTPGHDSSFGYVNPSTKEIKNIYFINPDYTSKKYLENKHDFSSLYFPNDNINKDPASRNAQYKMFGETVPLTINYTFKQNSPFIQGETLNVHTNLDDNERINEGVKYPNNKTDGNSDEQYSYEDYEPHDTTKNTDFPQPISNEDNSSQTYEVTERLSEKVELVTEKSNFYSKSHDDETRLEKRLPAILEKYVSYDNYDITAPLYDTDEYYRKT